VNVYRKEVQVITLTIRRGNMVEAFMPKDLFEALQLAGVVFTGVLGSDAETMRTNKVFVRFELDHLNTVKDVLDQRRKQHTTYEKVGG
jgi:hypothetical protein